MRVKPNMVSAEVAEQADAVDSKSTGPRAREGSTPSLGTTPPLRNLALDEISGYVSVVR